MATLLAFAACTSGEKQNTSRATSSTTSTTVTSPLKESVARGDSSAVAAYEDSIMRTLNFVEPHILPNGDTVRLFQYSFFDDPSTQDFTFLYYMRNGARYIAVNHDSVVAPGRRPRSVAQSRIRLPVIDSTDYVILEGRCAINGNDAPLIIGITGSKGDSVYRQARYAWKLDTTSRTLREIPTSGVTCRRESGEE